MGALRRGLKPRRLPTDLFSGAYAQARDTAAHCARRSVISGNGSTVRDDTVAVLTDRSNTGKVDTRETSAECHGMPEPSIYASGDAWAGIFGRAVCWISIALPCVRDREEKCSVFGRWWVCVDSPRCWY